MFNRSLDTNFLAYVFENDFVVAIPEIFLFLVIGYLLTFGLYFASNIVPKSRFISQKLAQKNNSSQALNKRSSARLSESAKFTRGVELSKKKQTNEQKPLTNLKVEAFKKSSALDVGKGKPLEESNHIFCFQQETRRLYSTGAHLLPNIVPSILSRNYASFYTQPALLSQNICWLSVLSLQLTAILLLNNSVYGAVYFFNSFISDFFTLFLKLFLIFGASCALAIGAQEFKKINYFESILLILFCVLGLLVLISSYNFITLYLAIELQSLCLYVLVASRSYSEFATEAGIKYFILGAFSSAMLLYGISLVYGFSGTVQFQELWLLIAQKSLPLGSCLGFIFIFLGFLFKITAAPFHTWAPDVYEGAATNITAFLAIVPKIAVFGAFLRLLLETTLLPSAANLWTYKGFYTVKLRELQSCLADSWGLSEARDQEGLGQRLFRSENTLGVDEAVEKGVAVKGEEAALGLQTTFSEFSGSDFIDALPSLTGEVSQSGFTDYLAFTSEGVSPTIFYIFMCCSILSMLIGSFAALSQKKVKRLLAFSSITGMGYLLIGLCCVSTEGLIAMLIHLSIYVIMTINFFAIVLVPVHRQELQPLQRVKFLADFSSLVQTNPLLATSLALNLLSLAGIPPLAGFLGKYYLLAAAVHSSLYALAFVAAFTTVISCVYYIRLIKVCYFEQLKNPKKIGPTDQCARSGRSSLIGFTSRTAFLRSQLFSFHRVSKQSSYVLGITLILIMILFFSPNSLNLISHYAALSLMF